MRRKLLDSLGANRVLEMVGLISIDKDGNEITDPSGNPANNTIIAPDIDIFIAGKKVTTTAATGGIQIWNPASSGVELTIKSLAAIVSTNCDVYIYNTTAAFTATPPDAGNINLDGNAPLGQIRTQTSGTVTGTRLATFSMVAPVVGTDSSNGNVKMTPPEQLWELTGCTIPEGYGLALVTAVAAALRVRASFTQSLV